MISLSDIPTGEANLIFAIPEAQKKYPEIN
jgi:hypothetical protein